MTTSPNREIPQHQTLPRTGLWSNAMVEALQLAPRLLGKFLKRDDVVLQITEVEAYRQNDSASRGRFGITPRTAPIFGPGGHAYFYLCYGLHKMLNIVADKEVVGAGVLISSCAPICDEHRLRNHPEATGTEDFETCPIIRPRKGWSGSWIINREWPNHPLYTPGVLELLDRPEPDEVLTGPLVGIDFALHENVNALWQFAIAGSPWISAPKNPLQAA